MDTKHVIISISDDEEDDVMQRSSHQYGNITHESSQNLVSQRTVNYCSGESPFYTPPNAIVGSQHRHILAEHVTPRGRNRPDSFTFLSRLQDEYGISSIGRTVDSLPNIVPFTQANTHSSEPRYVSGENTRPNLTGISTVGGYLDVRPSVQAVAGDYRNAAVASANKKTSEIPSITRNTDSLPSNLPNSVNVNVHIHIHEDGHIVSSPPENQSQNPNTNLPILSNSHVYYMAPSGVNSGPHIPVRNDTPCGSHVLNSFSTVPDINGPARVGAPNVVPLCTRTGHTHVSANTAGGVTKIEIIELDDDSDRKDSLIEQINNGVTQHDILEFDDDSDRKEHTTNDSDSLIEPIKHDVTQSDIMEWNDANCDETVVHEQRKRGPGRPRTTPHVITNNKTLRTRQSTASTIVTRTAEQSVDSKVPPVTFSIHRRGSPRKHSSLTLRQIRKHTRTRDLIRQELQNKRDNKVAARKRGRPRKVDAQLARSAQHFVDNRSASDNVSTSCSNRATASQCHTIVTGESPRTRTRESPQTRAQTRVSLKSTTQPSSTHDLSQQSNSKPENNLASTPKRGRPRKCENVFELNKSMECDEVHNASKRYRCGYCSKSFSWSTALIRHVRTHTHERPFSCTFCDKTFRFQRQLQVHVRRHTGEKPYACNICGKCFSRKVTLGSHQRTHTK